MKAVTLMYHDVCDDPGTSGFPGGDADLYKISEAKFRRHLDLIADIVNEPPSSVKDWRPDNDNIPLFITFDDGGNSAMRAADILDERGWKGHFFVTTGRIGTEGFLSENEIIELDRRGHVIGSHSDSHPLRMGALSREAIQLEWQKSTEILAGIISKPVITASVPGGFYSAVVRDEAFAAGIRHLFTSEPTTKLAILDAGKVLGRYSVTNRMSDTVLSGIVSGKDLSRIRQSLTWSIKKPIKKLGGESLLKIRKKILDR